MSDLQDIQNEMGKPTTALMRENQIRGKLSSKKDWYQFLEENLQYYLPPYVMVTKDHLKSVLSGKKAFLKMNQVSFCNPPAFDEIGVKALYEMVSKLDGMPQYFPDKFPKGAQCDRGYMYNIWNTIHPNDVKHVIEYANKQRYSVTAEKNKGEAIVITQEWQDQLDSLPFVSKQKGRMSYLLKQKSKLGVEQKDRVTYSAYQFLKRKRDKPFEIAQSQAQPQAQTVRPNSNNQIKKLQAKVVQHGDTDMGK